VQQSTQWNAYGTGGFRWGGGMASAQQSTINPEQACRDDAFKFCNNDIPDRTKVGACLRKHARSLSKDCRTVVTGGGGSRKSTKKRYRHS